MPNSLSFSQRRHRLRIYDHAIYAQVVFVYRCCHRICVKGDAAIALSADLVLGDQLIIHRHDPDSGSGVGQQREDEPR